MLTREIAASIDLLDLHRLAPVRYPVLLESMAHGTRHGRWDMLLVAGEERITLQRDGSVTDEAGRPVATGFLDALDAVWARARVPHADAPVPFVGGWALLLGYELAAEVEPILHLPVAPGSVPVAVAVRCPAAILRDRATGTCLAVAEEGAAELLECIALDASAAPSHGDTAWAPPASVVEDPPDAFTDGVRRVIGYLRAGDVFQANLSRAWQADFGHDVDASALFERLRAANPAPFAGLFAGDGWAVVSGSPERLVSVHGDRVETRPIAGTRPRVAGDDDAGRIRELIGHPKERAEHVMLIDLERNDLGRVCRPGTVEVDELMTVESYAHVHHIVSNVRGRLREGVTPAQVIRAVFPGGTITGCPKVRCMQIIAELEGVGRGAYTGAMGWLGRDGDMDLNILIRSAEVEGRRVRFRTGAGIVADSDPQRELDETRAKARGMLRALGVES